MLPVRPREDVRVYRRRSRRRAINNAGGGVGGRRRRKVRWRRRDTSGKGTVDPSFQVERVKLDSFSEFAKIFKTIIQLKERKKGLNEKLNKEPFHCIPDLHNIELLQCRKISTYVPNRCYKIKVKL